MNIEQLSDACGGLAWISEQMMLQQRRLALAEARLETIDVLDDHTKALLARSSRLFAQHEGWWRNLLPDSPALKGSKRVGPPTQEWANTFNRLNSTAPNKAVETLYGEVLAALVELIKGLLEQVSPISDEAFARVARMALVDLATEQAVKNS
ncbi:MAG: hypothetical protein F4138_03020 [Acidimicrobiia bacterium]|nr:hypothetical protein [Acidimicrobiia bacterium]MYC58272.1 hypothetical protein [Acidimicrobiia bacterium]MYG93952.1 hypothetical protein [Acidimicrobiia bacterium]MYI30970.1 hypothetical protein [Acidimicrobiia bacterium]